MNVIGQVLQVALWVFLLLLIVRLVMDYVMMFARSYEPRGLALVLLEVTYSVTDPPLKALRRVIPRYALVASHWTCRSWCCLSPSRS